ncbi:MAG: hypothetical protein IKB35_01260, partial [Clostridia bacterium]|nr:hypothetical protein [Clostridia bacterium]
MIYEISLDSLPYVSHAYYVQRRTVWQIADPDSLFIFAAEGRCQIKIDNDKYILERGCAVLIPQSRHYVRRPIDNEMCNLYYAHVRLRE